MIKFFVITMVLVSTGFAYAKLSIVTTVADLKSITKEVGGDFVEVKSLAKGTQDPHFLEAKPSYMVLMGRADLVISIGLDLEVGYLPLLLQGARNPAILDKAIGHLIVGPLIDPIEVVDGKISRAEGDVHPYGNPHFMLDPIRAGLAAVVIADRLSILDPTHKEIFKNNAVKLQERLAEKTKKWQERLSKLGPIEVITYHKTLNYFFDRFKIRGVATLEPKPGIPPTANHIMTVLKVINERKIPLVLIENFFDGSISKKLMTECPHLRVEVIPVSVEGTPAIQTIDDLYESIVSTILK